MSGSTERESDTEAKFEELMQELARVEEKKQIITARIEKKKKNELQLIEKILNEQIEDANKEQEKYAKRLRDYKDKEKKILEWLALHGYDATTSGQQCHCSSFKFCPKESKRRKVEDLIQMFGKMPYIIQVVASMHLWDVEITQGPNIFFWLMIVMFVLSTILMILRHLLLYQLRSENPKALFKHLEYISRLLFWMFCFSSLVIVCLASFYKGSPLATFIINSNLT